MHPTGNTILITGGTSGIGLALAEALMAQGNTVIVAARRQAALDAARAAHPGLHALPLDVADPASIAALAETLRRDHPALNVLVNNAGIMQAEDLRNPDTRVAEATIATNLVGPIRMTAALLPQLLAQPRATVANVTSGLAFVPLALTPAYSATKAALHSWTQSLRHQLGGTSVEVIEIAPPEVATELMPGQSQSPTAMPLADFTAETMAVLAETPTPPEVLTARVGFLRRAEAEGRFDAAFAAINSRHRG